MMWDHSKLIQLCWLMFQQYPYYYSHLLLNEYSAAEPSNECTTKDDIISLTLLACMQMLGYTVPFSLFVTMSHTTVSPCLASAFGNMNNLGLACTILSGEIA